MRTGAKRRRTKALRQYFSVFRYLGTGFMHNDIRRNNVGEVIHLLIALL